jgi:hypothetical protein
VNRGFVRSRTGHGDAVRRAGPHAAQASNLNSCGPQEHPMNRYFSPRHSAHLFAAAVVLIAAVFLAPAMPAWAGAQRPHVSRGTAQFVNANDFVGSGLATHLGRYEEAGSAQFTPTADPTVLQVDAQTTYTAANGDELHAVISGHLDAVTGKVTGTVTYVGGTGRFSDATGTAALSAQLLPGGAVQAAVQGTIDY